MSGAVIRVLLAGLAGLVLAAQADDNRVAIVVRTGAGVPPLTRTEVRQIFLGAPVFKGGHTLRALRNDSDPALEQTFVAASANLTIEAYERQLMSRVFRLGSEPPKTYRTLPDLLDVLAHCDECVTFLWARDLPKTPGVTVVLDLGP